MRKSQYNYKKADKSIIFNDNDEDLYPIEYKLPEPPPYEQIDGYGLKPEDQFWQPKPMPPGLKKLNDDQKLTPSQKIKVLEASQEHYAEEIAYIKQEWKRRKNGYWLFINGKPYFIPGDNYFFLQWWTIENKLPVFRMRDREWWLWVKFCDEDPYCMGFNYPKGRREGATTRASCKRFLVASSTPHARVGLQSKDDTHAKEVHQTHVLDQFKYEIPFWFKPIWDDDLRNGTSINFYSPDTKSHPDFMRKALRSIIDFRPSNITAYDGLKLRYLHVDEIGKTTEIDVSERWEVQKECLVQGSKIIGKAVNTSTVEKMESAGGKEFKKIADGSHYENRQEDTGRTKSGLYNFFIPSYEGYGDEDGVPPHYEKKYGIKAWIDKYGFDVIDPETGRPLAEKFLRGLLQSFLDSNDIEGWIDQTRKYPMRWRDSWRQKASNNNFDLEIIERRLDYYRHGNPDVQRGDFMWQNGVLDSKVVWAPSATGRFVLSYQFPDPSQTNRFFMSDGKRCPANATKFFAGSDTYKFKLTKNKKRSSGGGAVYWKFDAAIDANKDIKDWESERFVCTYLFNPGEPWIYCEDMLMMCVWFGCKMYPEMNITDVRNHFIKRGYGMYLLYRIDEQTGKTEANPGDSTGTATIDAIFRKTQFHIKHHGHRERHTDWLEQCKLIEDDMGPFDLFAAGGYAQLAADLDSFIQYQNAPINIEELFPTYTYADN